MGRHSFFKCLLCNDYPTVNQADGITEKPGHGLSDNAYNSFKSTYLLKNSDYSFWDIKQGTAYEIRLDIFPADNLNEITSVLIDTDSVEEAYAVMNSAKSIK